MKRTIEAVYDGEVLRPREPLDLEPNTRYRITVEETVGAADEYDDRPLMNLLDLVQPLDLPTDFASQLHHYLHGHPRE